MADSRLNDPLGSQTESPYVRAVGRDEVEFAVVVEVAHREHKCVGRSGNPVAVADPTEKLPADKVDRRRSLGVGITWNNQRSSMSRPTATAGRMQRGPKLGDAGNMVVVVSPGSMSSIDRLSYWATSFSLFAENSRSRFGLSSHRDQNGKLPRPHFSADGA
jgi:hypothetical protein